MDAVDRDELYALRARAYGAAADIDEDPAALRRLQELESRLGAPASEPGPGDSDLVSAPRGSGPPTAVESARHAEDDPAGAPARARGRRWIGIGILWVLSVVAAAGVASAVTFMNTSVPAVSAVGAEHRIATLKASTLTELPEEWFGSSSSSLVFDFHGLTLFTTDSGLGTGTNCFIVVPTSEVPHQNADAGSWAGVGVILSGCKAGAFPAAAQATVDGSFPDELRTAFPSGTALKFVLEGEQVLVYSSGS